jgi:hypothetical protein
MAIFIPGMRCALSGRTVASREELVAFPAFVANEADPLFVFSDAVIHIDAFRQHPLAEAAQARLEEGLQRTPPRNRRCLACANQILDVNDYVGVGHLTPDREQPLYRFNYAQFHRTCLSSWPGRANLVAALDLLEQSGTWRGGALKRTIHQLREIAAPG